jgi:NAD(P) transhydrogenase
MAPQVNHFGVDLTDEVVRGAIVTHNGEIVPTAPRPAPPSSAAPSTQAATGAKETVVVALTPWQKTTREVAIVTAGMGSVLALGKATGPLFMGNVFTFALAGLIGYRVVWGVAPALHSPLMSVTNAISGEFSKSSLTVVMELTCSPLGMVGVGGFFIMGGGILPQTFPQVLGALSVLLAFVNVSGGFVITKRMLDMFKRMFATSCSIET